ncbi:unnamed protein product [Rotaria sp. Silwood1]|nr:unnamed protein product [Rotaria sp. Silwood1]
MNKIPCDRKFTFEIINCSILPPCLYYSSESCIAVNVPLECPRLCGLCDRYEVLKSVYGENNLAPNILAVKPTTITTTIRLADSDKTLQ